MIISLLDRACPASVDIFRRPVPYTAAVSYIRGRVARVAWPVTASLAALRSVQLLALRFLPCYDLWKALHYSITYTSKATHWPAKLLKIEHMVPKHKQQQQRHSHGLTRALAVCESTPGCSCWSRWPVSAPCARRSRSDRAPAPTFVPGSKRHSTWPQHDWVMTARDHNTIEWWQQVTTTRLNDDSRWPQEDIYIFGEH